MKLIKAEKNRKSRIGIKCQAKEKNALQRKANIYTDGNLSAYLIYAGLNFVPGKEDFEEEKSQD